MNDRIDHIKLIIKHNGKYKEPRNKDLNKINKNEYWKFFLQEDNISSDLFYYNKNITKDEAKALFKKYVCVVDIETSTVCNRKCDYCPLSIHERKEQTLIDDKLYSRILLDLSSILILIRQSV